VRTSPKNEDASRTCRVEDVDVEKGYEGIPDPTFAVLVLTECERSQEQDGEMYLTSIAFPTWRNGVKETTFLKNWKFSSPVGEYGNAVTGVSRGHEIIDTSAIPMRMAPLTR
jgi:hypothetical protein